MKKFKIKSKVLRKALKRIESKYFDCLNIKSNDDALDESIYFLTEDLDGGCFEYRSFAINSMKFNFECRMSDFLNALKCFEDDVKMYQKGDVLILSDDFIKIKIKEFFSV